MNTKKLSIFLVLILSLFLVRSSLASTSCCPEFTFIGFSKDMNIAYFEGQYTGECTPSLVLYEYDPDGSQSVSTASKFDLEKHNIEDWRLENVQGKDVLSKDRKIREAAKRRFWQTNYFPNLIWSKAPVRPFLMEQSKGKEPEKALFATSEVDQNIWFLQGPVRMSAITFRSGTKSCFFPRFSPRYIEEESYLSGIGEVVGAYYLTEDESWILINEHPNVGDTGNFADSVRIHKMYDCKDITR